MIWGWCIMNGTGVRGQRRLRLRVHYHLLALTPPPVAVEKQRGAPRQHVSSLKRFHNDSPSGRGEVKINSLERNNVSPLKRNKYIYIYIVFVFAMRGLWLTDAAECFIWASISQCLAQVLTNFDYVLRYIFRFLLFLLPPVSRKFPVMSFLDFWDGNPTELQQHHRKVFGCQQSEQRLFRQDKQTTTKNMPKAAGFCCKNKKQVRESKSPEKLHRDAQ